MADQGNPDKKENKLEYEQLIEGSKEQKPRNNRERAIIISTIIAIVVVAIIITFSVIFLGKKYKVTINYSINKESNMTEPYSKIKVELKGLNVYESVFPIGTPIELKVEEGTYELNVLAVDDNNIAYYYYSEPSLFIKDNMTLDNVKLNRNSIKFSIDYKWQGNDLYITLPSGYDQYLIYKKNNAGIYEPFKTSSQNVVLLSSLPSEGLELKFAVVKENKVFGFSNPYVFLKNVPPSQPIVLSPTENQQIEGERIYFVWQSEDLDNDELTFDIYLKEGFQEEKLIASNITNYFYEYNYLEPGKSYTLKIVAKDGKGGESTTQIRFSTKEEVTKKVYLYSPSGKYGVTIYEVGDPNNPKEISSIQTSGNVTDVIQNDNYLYILRLDEGIDIADISNPETPIIKSKLDLKGVNGIKMANGYLYLRFTGDKVSVYSIKEDPSHPKFLGYTDIKFYGSEKPEIVYVEKQTDITVDIIKGEYPIRINLNNRVYVTEFSFVVADEEIKEKVEKSFAKVFDTLRIIFSTYSPEQFRKSGIEKELENKLLIAINELLGTTKENGVKQVKLSISRVE
ncbi:MAG TPA: hypothetical protein PK894_00225 [Defluviitoga sp.]|nr:hypothetical protein [Defluviitoga sp.]HOP24283.1 hypothetical protein [Defluviitoga sp.]HPZ28125.1 hypothetical protein [Defluviitoga sp.]HQD62015.1 hypothetical protein [Defluviitoga sp.]